MTSLHAYYFLNFILLHIKVHQVLRKMTKFFHWSSLYLPLEKYTFCLVLEIFYLQIISLENSTFPGSQFMEPEISDYNFWTNI